MLQPAPFVVDVVKQAPATPDISVSVVISVLVMPLIAMAAAGIGGLCVGGIIVLYKRWREGNEPTAPQSSVSLSQPFDSASRH